MCKLAIDGDEKKLVARSKTLAMLDKFWIEFAKYPKWQCNVACVSLEITVEEKHYLKTRFHFPRENPYKQDLSFIVFYSWSI